MTTFALMIETPKSSALQQQYLTLLKKSLTDLLRPGKETYYPNKKFPINFINNLVNPFGYAFARKKIIDTSDAYLEGKDHSPYAETLIGMKRLDCIEYCLTEIIKDNIPGDLLEAGVWRGGATIFMAGYFKALEITDRKIFVSDSFEGCPPPTNVIDKKDNYYQFDLLSVGLNLVQDNFRNYNLLSDQIVFLKGWFKDTLPNGPFNKLALIRIDGDMYESTMDALEATYSRLSPGGFLIVDDYSAIEASKLAVDDFRKSKNITEAIHFIDWAGIYWRKESVQ